MARKNEFKPDKPRSGLLSKLYLTQKQRMAILRWTLYSLLLLVLSVLQDVMLCRVRIFGATTDLVPCGIFLICILNGMHQSCFFALMASLFYLFSGTAPGPYCIALIVFISVLVTYFRQSFLQKSFSAVMLCITLAMALYELTVFFASLLMGLTVLQRVSVSGLTAGLTLLTAPALYPLVKAIGTIGGEIWKE